MFIKKKQPAEGTAAATRGREQEPQRAGEVVDVEDAREVTPGLKVTKKADPASPPASGNAFARFRAAKAPDAAEPVAEKRGIFGRKRVEASEPPLATEVKPVKKGLFGGGKSAAKPKSAKAEARTSAPKDSMDVLVELEGNRRVCWRVGPQSLDEIPPERVARAASFSRNEFRYSVDQPLKYGAAQDLALAEIGEDVRIVNASRQTSAVYATTAARIAEMGSLATGPGLMLLEMLLKSERAEGEELIFGLLLTGAQESRSLAVLYHITKHNEVAATQITVNPDNLTFVLQQFASSRRLDAETAKFVLFKNEDLLKVAGKLQLYPNEPMWNGLSLRRVLWTAVLGAAVGAAGAGAYASTHWVSVKLLKSQLASASSKKSAAAKNIDELLTGSVASFASTQALHLPVVTERAGKLWFPGTRVAVEVTGERELYTINLPLTRGGLVGGNPSVLQPVSMGEIQPVLTVQPPEGCTKDIPNISGGMNAVQVIVTCESPAGPLAAYRLN